MSKLLEKTAEAARFVRRWFATVFAIIGLLVVVLAVYEAKRGADNSAAANRTNILNTCRSKYNAAYVTKPNQQVANATSQMQLISLKEIDLQNRGLYALVVNDKAIEAQYVPQLAALSAQAIPAEMEAIAASARSAAAYLVYLGALNRSNTDPAAFLADCKKLPAA